MVTVHVAARYDWLAWYVSDGVTDDVLLSTLMSAWSLMVSKALGLLAVDEKIAEFLSFFHSVMVMAHSS